MVPHQRIHNTALAAAIATLGVDPDPTEPYNRMVDAHSGQEQITFLFRDASSTDPTRRTEEIITAWEHRKRFEADFPTHPLVHMRAAHDARNFLLAVIHGREVPPVRQFKGDKHQTGHIQEAAILRAHGFPLLLFTGRAWSFPAVHRGRAARQILEDSLRPHGQRPAQWQHKFLINLSRYLDVAKCTPTVAVREDDKVLLLSADASKKTTDFWYDLL